MTHTQQVKSAGGIVNNAENKVLMVEEFSSFWGFPRGRIEPGESELDAAVREIYEETGITQLSLQHFIGSYIRPKYDLQGTPDPTETKHITFMHFTTEQNALSPIDKDITDAQWVDFTQVRKKLTISEDIAFFETHILPHL